MITYCRKSIPLDQAEWVSCWAVHTATKRCMYPTTHHSDYHFGVGRYPYQGAPTVTVHDYIPGRQDVRPASWTFLVNLSKQYLEPRLLNELVAWVRRGETGTVGGSVKALEHSDLRRKVRALIGSGAWSQMITPPGMTGATP